ncbi:Uncharacterised protein [Bordetella pertussis]|nr:Uncharacterised protein [Bordetella pertussis]
MAVRACCTLVPVTPLPRCLPCQPRCLPGRTPCPWS